MTFHHRAYASEKVYEIITNTDASCKFDAINTLIPTFPREEDNAIHILRSFPLVTDLVPEAFEPGCRQSVELTARHSSSALASNFPFVQTDWDAFLEIYPQSDNVHDYITADNPLHIPLYNELFNIDPKTPPTEVTKCIYIICNIFFVGKIT